jgi:uncharacterized protein
MEETLDVALNRLFPRGGGPSTPAPTSPSGASPTPAAPLAPESSDELSARAMDHYRRALQAQREGNWAQYGEEIKRLGEALEGMRVRK